MAKAEDLKTKEECIEWVRKRTPFAIKPKGKAKTILIYPFTSHHSFLEVTKVIGEQIYASQSRPAVLMPDVAKIYEYIKEEHHLRLHGKPGEMSTHRLTMGQAEYLQLCLDVAKWALSQVQAIDGRELLIKFAEFLNENINEDEIDAFLRDNAT